MAAALSIVSSVPKRGVRSRIQAFKSIRIAFPATAELSNIVAKALIRLIHRQPSGGTVADPLNEDFSLLCRAT
jgi:hypothetical protein